MCNLHSDSVQGFAEHMPRLECVSMVWCESLSSLPASLNLQTLVTSRGVLSLHGCKRLVALPTSFGDLASLEHLDLSYCDALCADEETFTVLRKLTSLKILQMQNCQNLHALPTGTLSPHKPC